MTTRNAAIQAIQRQPNLSVLIVGGGVNGISTFRELALQGIDVLLVEANDFSSGASAGSSHMIHGGLRYLENGEFRLVQEALTERNRLLLNAPHYVRPLPTTIPIFKWMSGTLNAPLKFLRLTQRPAERGAFIIKIGLTLYDLFASTQKTMPNHSFQSKTATLQRFPGIDPEVTVSATYYDAWMPYPERICLEMILDSEAANPNAHALNYMRVEQGAGDSVTLRDALTGECTTIKPQIVINAAGPWIDFANQNLHRPTEYIGGTKGSHLVLDHPELHRALDGHEIFFENHDGRIVLIFPLEDRVLCGTTDIRTTDPDSIVCTDEEISYILTLVQRIFPSLQVGREHIVYTFCGVRPLPSQKTATTGQISRDHSIEVLPAGAGTSYPIYSLVGGKWTTFRAFGEQAADLVLAQLGVQRHVTTDQLAIGGGADYPRNAREQGHWVLQLASHTGLTQERVQTLFERYGTRAEAVARFISNGNRHDAPLTYAPSYSMCEVAYVVREEKVFTLLDFIQRRSLLAMLGKVTLPLLEELAGLIGMELHWTPHQVAEQVALASAVLEGKHRVALREVGL